MRAERSWVALAGGLVSMALTAAFAPWYAPDDATAATTIGRAQGQGSTTCASGPTRLQTNTASTSPSYAVPAGGGVIVAWSVQAFELDEGLKLKVFRPTPDSATFTVVGESGFMDFPGPGLQQFATRIPVEAGDTIGYKVAPNSFTGCVLTTFEPADVSRIVPGDPPVGSTFTTTGTAQNQTLNIAAVVEADSDNDGFGDETQDNCPTQGGEGDGCPPDTLITKGPTAKTKKKTATFEFTGTDVRAIASFQCKLDSGALAPCTSPHTVKVKKGKHRFEVQAIDQAGNVGSPATDTWKRKKRNK